MKKKHTVPKSNESADTVYEAVRAYGETGVTTDPLGSYTGIADPVSPPRPAKGKGKLAPGRSGRPVQDADDL